LSRVRRCVSKVGEQTLWQVAAAALGTAGVFCATAGCAKSGALNVDFGVRITGFFRIPVIDFWRSAAAENGKIGFSENPISYCRDRTDLAFLTRTEPVRNIDRFYLVEVTPTLFGEFAVLREWGRRGSPGTVRLNSYSQRGDAELAERRSIKKRLQHGYNTVG